MDQITDEERRQIAELMAGARRRGSCISRSTGHGMPSGGRADTHQRTVDLDSADHDTNGGHTSTEAGATDPVCGMRVNPGTAPEHRGNGTSTTWFCSAYCAAAFDADPARYTPIHPASGSTA